MSDFLKPNDPNLRKISKKIPKSKIFSPEIQKDINRMIKIALTQQKEKGKPIMVGIASPQIGILKRIILVDIAANGKGRVGDIKIYINPKIIWKSKKKEEWYEGCYSTGKVCGIVLRSSSIRVKGFTLPKWNLVEEEYSGYTARIFQHEIDHLNGKIFVDHIKNPNNLHLVNKNEFKLYRNKEAWRNWPKKYKNPLIQLRKN